MPREWFELQRGTGRPEYLHSKTGTTLHRPPGMTDADWIAARSEFFRKFPKALEIRTGSAIACPTALIPHDATPVFAPGDTLACRVVGASRPSTVKVVGIQMPLFCNDDQPSYLLDDGLQMFWNGGLDCWMLRSECDKEIAVGSRKAKARRKKAA